MVTFSHNDTIISLWFVSRFDKILSFVHFLCHKNYASLMPNSHNQNNICLSKMAPSVIIPGWGRGGGV